MWSRRGVLQLLAGGAALAVLAPTLAACGFKPLYGSRTPGGQSTGQASVDQQLAAVRVEPIADELGQRVHNALRDGLNPLGQPVSSSHRLKVKLIVRVYGALARSDLSATRRNVEITAFYSMTDNSGNTVLNEQLQTNTGYDEFDDPLNDITANQHAQERSALQVANMIKTRLAVYFAQHTAQAGQ